MEIGAKVMATKKEKWDGRSRPSNKAYDEGYERIFGKKEDYFKSKSVKKLLDDRDEEELKEIDKRNGF